MGSEAEIGARIRELRIRSGAKAASLANKVGLSPSAWSRIEAGERSVKTSELGRIASALGVSPLAILDESSLLGQLPIAARAIDGGHIDGSTVIARLTAFAELDDVLRNGGLRARPVLNGLPSVGPSNWLDDSERLATWVRHRLERVSFEPNLAPFDRLVVLIQSALGIDVAVEDHSSDPLLGAAITDRTFPLVFVNASQQTPRSIFTLAHELGHVLCGTSEPLSLDRDLTAKNESERFANAFAASLLMPEDEIRAHVEAHGRDADSLAVMLLKFGVSFESLVYRLQNLRIINRTGGDRLRSVGFNGLLSTVNDRGLQGRLLAARSAAVPTSPPLLLTHRVATGWRRGIVSIRPLAGLLDADADDLLASFERAQSGAIDADYSQLADESAEEAYAGSPI